MRAASGQAALDTLSQLKAREEPVALLISDQRMPGMTGVEFLERARELYPEAKRVLLTAYADTEAAIRAINTARIHYYLNKPWDPPEEKLYPVLNDLLDDWKAGYRPPFEGLRVIGNRWALNDHNLRNFLSRNHVPYRWIDATTDRRGPEAAEERHLKPEHLPVVLFADGSALADANPDALAAKVGLSTHATQEFYDMVVVGAGPAGLAAAVYGASEGLKTLVVEPEAPGGQAGSSSRIENYLGFPAGITGADLGRRAHIQASRFGAEFVTQRAVGLRIDGQYRFVQLGRRPRSLLPRGSARAGRAIPETGDSRRRPAHGPRNLLRRRAGGGSFVQGRRSLRGGRRKFRRAGGSALCQICPQSHHVGARRRAYRHHVEIFNR